MFEHATRASEGRIATFFRRFGERRLEKIGSSAYELIEYHSRGYPYGLSSVELSHRFNVDQRRLQKALDPYLDDGRIVIITVGEYALFSTPNVPQAAPRDQAV